MKTAATFDLPLAGTGRAVLRQLGEAFALEAEGQERRRWTILDSFDWRLLGEGMALLQERRQCELRRLEGDELVANVELPAKAKPGFAESFPEGTLRGKVAGPLSIRAVMPRAEFIREAERWRVVNRDGKTIARLEVETLARPVARQKPMPFQRALRVIALKGYEGAADKVGEQLLALGLVARTDSRHYAFAALEAAGQQPFDYCSKIKLVFDPDVTAREACAVILNDSWDQMQANVPGMLADIDSEFLHDFRVALRRTRSLLQLVKGVYPESEVTRFKGLLGDIMRRTNRLRDLDVYLLEREAYADLLPEALRPGLRPFFNDLRAERAKAFRRFAREFQGTGVGEQLRAWQGFLGKGARLECADCPDGELPVGVLARRLLRKRFNRIIKDGRKINDDTPDEAVHQLRIQFKKLRYLLEFFRSLFDRAELDFLIKRSRKLQNTLGRFNDLCVQQRTITDYLAKVDLRRPEAVQLCAALGALVAELERERHATRHLFHGAFATLDDPRTLATAEHLFHVPSAPVEPPAPVASAPTRKRKPTASRSEVPPASQSKLPARKKNPARKPARRPRAS